MLPGDGTVMFVHDIISSQMFLSKLREDGSRTRFLASTKLEERFGYALQNVQAM